MIRAVIDTNIVVSAFFWGGQPRTVLNAARTKRFRMISTEAMLDELKEVISRPKFADRLALIGETAESLLENDYRALVEIVEPAHIELVIADDPEDDILIACALGGAADFIVSGDHHLLDMEQYQTIRIWPVNRFLEAVIEL